MQNIFSELAVFDYPPVIWVNQFMSRWPHFDQFVDWLGSAIVIQVRSRAPGGLLALVRENSQAGVQPPNLARITVDEFCCVDSCTFLGVSVAISGSPVRQPRPAFR